MFCSRCGNQVQELYRFCNICGNPLVPPVSPVEAPKAPEELQPIAPLIPLPDVLKATAAPIAEDPLSAKPAQLLHDYNVPESVKRNDAKIKALRLFEDRLVCIMDSGQQNTFPFDKYPSVCLITAGKQTQYAQIVMIPQGQRNTFDPEKSINSLNYPNKLPFCSGLIHTEPANAFAQKLYQDIKAAIKEYNA